MRGNFPVASSTMSEACGALEALLLLFMAQARPSGHLFSSAGGIGRMKAVSPKPSGSGQLDLHQHPPEPSQVPARKMVIHKDRLQ